MTAVDTFTGLSGGHLEPADLVRNGRQITVGSTHRGGGYFLEIYPKCRLYCA